MGRELGLELSTSKAVIEQRFRSPVGGLNQAQKAQILAG